MLSDRSKMIFTVSCTLLLVYMITCQTIRYIANRDTSSISYKPFDQSSHGKYPTFSLCIKGMGIYSFRETRLMTAFGITSSQYASILMGQIGARYDYNYKNGLYDKTLLDVNNVTKIDVMHFAPNLSDIIIATDFMTQDPIYNIHYKGKEAKINKKSTPFKIGFQTPDEICFTRNELIEDSDLRKDYDMLFLKSFLMYTESFHENLVLRIIVHYPGQLMRSYEKPVFKSNFRHFYLTTNWTLSTHHIN